jgi:hypothetical protein
VDGLDAGIVTLKEGRSVSQITWFSPGATQVTFPGSSPIVRAMIW